MIDSEHLSYDFSMAEWTYDQLVTETGQVQRNVLHAACPVYIYNLLTWLDIDIDNFRQRVDNQVRSLSDRRTAIMSEKLNNPDYRNALDLIANTLHQRGLIYDGKIHDQPRSIG